MISGMTTTGTQAPMVNFDTTTTTSTMPVATAPTLLMTAPLLPARLPLPAVVPDHAGLRQREAGEHAHGVERDEGGGHAAEGDEQAAGRQRQEQDAVGEHQPVAPVEQLPGEEPVPGDDRAHRRERVVGGVGGQDEDGGGGRLEDDVQHPVPEDGPAQDRQDRLVLVEGGLQVLGQHGDAEEERPEDGHHGDEGPGGVLRLGSLEHRDGVARWPRPR